MIAHLPEPAVIVIVAADIARIAFFLAIAFVSCWFFYKRIDERLFKHFPKPWDIPPGQTRKRLWNVFSEVILQSRVVRDRPVAGFLHALVVWGFIVFGWVTLNHLSLGILGFDHVRERSDFYGTFAAVWAAAVLVGILSLSFRRFVLRPKELGAVSMTSGIVAALISLLMVTYLLGWKVLAVASSEWKVNWWVHTLSFFTCPANQIGGSLSPKEIILDMQRGLLHGGDLIAGTAEEKQAGSVWIQEEDLFQCLSCGACEYVCPVGIEHVGRKILDLRRGLVSEGRVSNEKVVTLFTTMERAPHNPWGISQDTRKKFIDARKFPIFDGTQDWLFWLGCGLSFDPHGQEVAGAMQQILDAAGVSWGVLARESCCGEPARRAGNEYLYLQLAEELAETFSQNRVKKIVSCDPHCTTMLDVDYRQIASYAQKGTRVVHHSELIEELLPRLQLKRSAESATYHDPCYLARGRGITEQPRKVLESCGISISEASHHGQNTYCCGAGGAQLFIADDRREQTAGRVNQKRFAQLAETKASTIAVACPYCPIMLRDAAGHAKRDDIAILDLAEIVASRLDMAGK
ncbi:MAG: (Fe-S)-binding protein [Candidatus Acidiferrales bacterium]